MTARSKMSGLIANEVLLTLPATINLLFVLVLLWRVVRNCSVPYQYNHNMHLFIGYQPFSIFLFEGDQTESQTRNVSVGGHVFCSGTFEFCECHFKERLAIVVCFSFLKEWWSGQRFLGSLLMSRSFWKVKTRRRRSLLFLSEYHNTFRL